MPIYLHYQWTSIHNPYDSWMVHDDYHLELYLRQRMLGSSLLWYHIHHMKTMVSPWTFALHFTSIYGDVSFAICTYPHFIVVPNCMACIIHTVYIRIKKFTLVKINCMKYLPSIGDIIRPITMLYFRKMLDEFHAKDGGVYIGIFIICLRFGRSFDMCWIFICNYRIK